MAANHTGLQMSTVRNLLMAWVLTLPVASVSLQPSFTAAYPMKQGDTLILHASTYTSNGANLTGRLVTWVSTNSRVVSVTASSGSPDAVVTAAGQGTALILAVPWNWHGLASAA